MHIRFNVEYFIACLKLANLISLHMPELINIYIFAWIFFMFKLYANIGLFRYTD